MRDVHKEEGDEEDERKDEQADEVESEIKDTSDDRHQGSNNLRLQIQRGYARQKIKGRRVHLYSRVCLRCRLGFLSAFQGLCLRSRASARLGTQPYVTTWLSENLRLLLSRTGQMSVRDNNNPKK